MFKNFTVKDLTSELVPITQHWKSLGESFDAIYTGYLGSVEQVQIVSDFFDSFGREDNFIVVDPVLGDGGSLYAGMTQDFVTEMRKLCRKADYILPNMTEAAFLLGIPYSQEHDQSSVENILRQLAALGCATPIITGVRFDSESQGAAAYDSANDKFYYSFSKSVDKTVHGTGDIFASVFTGAVTLGKSLERSLNIAVRYTYDCIEATLPCFDEMWYGTCFEACLGNLITYLNE